MAVADIRLKKWTVEEWRLDRYARVGGPAAADAAWLATSSVAMPGTAIAGPETGTGVQALGYMMQAQADLKPCPWEHQTAIWPPELRS